MGRLPPLSHAPHSSWGGVYVCVGGGGADPIVLPSPSLLLSLPGLFGAQCTMCSAASLRPIRVF